LKSRKRNRGIKYRDHNLNKGDDFLAPGQDQSSRDSGLFSLVTAVLSDLGEKRIEVAELLALFSLFNLLGILNLLAGGVNGVSRAGGKDVSGVLLNMLQKQGKKLDPQMLGSLLSLIGEKGGGLPEVGKAGKVKKD